MYGVTGCPLRTPEEPRRYGSVVSPRPSGTPEDQWGHGPKPMSPCHSVSPHPPGTLALGCPRGALGAFVAMDPGVPTSLCVPASPGDNRGPLGTQIWDGPVSPGDSGGPLGTRIQDGPTALCVPISRGDIGGPLGTQMHHAPMSPEDMVSLWGHGSGVSPWHRVPRSVGDKDPGCPHVPLCPHGRPHGREEPAGTRTEVSPCPSVSPRWPSWT